MSDQPSNADLQHQIETRFSDMEHRLENIERLVQQAAGAWFLTKMAAALTLSLAAIWHYIHEWWTK